MTARKGDVIAGYEIVARVGAGGMATVYQAYHEGLDRHVAIKVLHDSFIGDESFLQRFEREARIVARLEHPRIVPIYDYADADGRPYLVMKYIDGGTLKRRVIKGGVDLEDLLRLMSGLADALSYAHDNGVLHRDIKPSNILIDERGQPYLTDFGLARIAEIGDSTISHDMMLGTPYYISPEQARGERDLTPASDVYAFAVVLYELLAGELPFGGETPYAIVHEHMVKPPTPPSAINSGLPAAVDDVLLKALAKRPADRYQSAKALMRDLKLALADSGLMELPPLHVASFGEGAAAGLNAAVGLDDEAGKEKPKRKPSPEESIRQRVQKKLKARSDFVQHLTVYAAVNLFCWAIWLFTRGGFPWPIFVSAFWGIGLVNQYVDYHYKHGRGAERGEEEIASEITRQLEIGGKRKRPRIADDESGVALDDIAERGARLRDDGELSDSFVADIERDSGAKRERFS